jgi:outer membrane translocation and assembly module TamA
MKSRFAKRYVLFIAILLKGVTAVFSQNTSVQLFFISNDTITTHFPDSLNVYQHLKDIQLVDLDKGFFKAGYDSVDYHTDTVFAYYNKGELHAWKRIDINVDNHSLKQKLSSKKWQQKPPSPKRMVEIMDVVREEFQCLGYADCRVTTDSLNTEDNVVFWEIGVDMGNRYFLDSIHIIPEKIFPVNYLYYLSGMEKHSLFNPQKLRELESGLFNPQFAVLESIPELIFLDSSFHVKLQYKEEKNNSLNGVLGIVPGNEAENLYLTGEVFLNFHNVFHAAEEIKFQWNSFSPSSQKLDMSYFQPVIFGPWGLVSKFNLLKQDSSFVNINFRLGANRFMYASGLNVFGEWFSTDLIEANPENDSIAGTKHQLIGLSYRFQKLDYVLNPKQGFALFVEAAAGVKQVSENNLSVFNSSLSVDWFLPIKNKWSLHLKNTSAMKYSPAGIKKNEMYRIGGLQNLRGQDEKSIFAMWYIINSAELLYYIDKQSAAFVFSDFALLNDNYTLKSVSSLIQYGIGAGFKLNTNIGLFSMNFAVPNSDSVYFDFRKTKVHIGYLNRF